MKKYEIKEFIEKINVLFCDINRALKETDEMQNSFNNEYVNNFEKNYDKSESLIIDGIIEIYKQKLNGRDSLMTAIKNEIEIKRPVLKGRIKDFQDELIKIEESFQKLKIEKTNFLKGYMKINPELNSEEESLKNLIAIKEKELAPIREYIEKKGSGIISSLVNFFPIFWNRRKFYKCYDELTAEKTKLLEIRQMFLKAKTKKDELEKNIEARFNDNLKKAAYIRQTLFKLENDFENALIEEATTKVISSIDDKSLTELKTRITEMDKFMELRRLKKEYEESLKKVSEEIGFLTGIKSGVENILKTLKSLNDQYLQYKSYLKPLVFEVTDFFDKFSGCFNAMAVKIEDDKKLASAPEVFLKLVGPFHADFLNEKAVKKFFDELGSSLNKATADWK